MKNLIILCISFIFLSNCNIENKIYNYTLEPTSDSVYIRIGKRELNSTLCNQSFSQNDSNYLAILNKDRNSIYFYNIDQQKLVKEIIIEKEGVNAFPGFRSFVIKNMDTIILISNWPGSVGIINEQGTMIKKIPIDKDGIGKMLRPSLSWFGEKGILIDSILYILQVESTIGYNGLFTSEMQKQSDIAISVNLKNSNVKSLPLKYPNELVGKDIFNLDNIWVGGYNDCFIYISSIMNNIFVTQDFSGFRKVTIQTDYDLKLPENMMKYASDLTGFLKYSASKDNLLTLLYDRYRKCYYLLVKKRLTNKTQDDIFRSDYLYPDCFIIILDKEFKHMGDVYFPENIYSFMNMFITKKGLYISEDHVNNPTYSEDTMRFRLFKLKEIDGK